MIVHEGKRCIVGEQLEAALNVPIAHRLQITLDNQLRLNGRRRSRFLHL
jgi:hypothetical protein